MQVLRNRYRADRKQAIITGLVVLTIGVLIMTIAMSQYVAGHGSSMSPVTVRDNEWLTTSLVTRDWSSLAVTYRMGNTVVRLDYQDAYHWRKEILENRDDSELAGTVMTFEDSTYREYPVNTIDKRTGQAFVYEETLTGGIEVPERWLHPGFLAVLIQNHFVSSDNNESGTLKVQQTLTIPCTPQEPGHPPIPQPAACERSDTYREVETWTFRTDITPPMVIAGRSEADGQVQWQVEVLSVERAP